MIKPSTGVQEIGDQLERRGLITDARIFWIGVSAYGNDGQLKAGEYEIKPAASMYDIMEILKSGKSVMYSLTIPEGLTVEQAFERIAKHDALSGDMPAAMPPEGSLATDTMRFTRGATRQQIIDKMVADQKKLVDDIWGRRQSDLPITTEEEFVTLASIVEKETGRSDERSRVASVFMNRLKKGMRLQSDPTIIYGLFGGKGKPSDRPIYQSDLDKPTPYNTYLDRRACRRRRSPIPAAPRSKRSPTRRRPTISISSPTVPAGMSLLRRSKSIMRTSPAIGNFRRSRPKKPPSPPTRPGRHRKAGQRRRAGRRRMERATRPSEGRPLVGGGLHRTDGERGLWHCKA